MTTRPEAEDRPDRPTAGGVRPPLELEKEKKWDHLTIFPLAGILPGVECFKNPNNNTLSSVNIGQKLENNYFNQYIHNCSEW